MTDKKLKIKFHGRIIDHLGIQMYQSPTAAIAEMISNSWDADADNISVHFPPTLDEDSVIEITDDGIGMTFSDCENRFLNVGYSRRGSENSERSKDKDRPILGRKGIGKFAGFGIAKTMRIQTVSKETGERTVFILDVETLRGEKYVEEGGIIDVLEYEEPDEKRKLDNETKITLGNLMLARNISPNVFCKSMSRRFLIHERAADFKVKINELSLDAVHEDGIIQFSFPKDYEGAEIPTDMIVENDWGYEEIKGHMVRWQFNFYEEPIEEKELQGISIFANGKLAQAPFWFNLTGGLGGQHGQQYLSGQVEADFLDELPIDIISPERQRINWESPETSDLLTWGQNRVKKLLEIWKNRRAKEKISLLEDKITPFSQRLEKLPRFERKIIERAILRIAAVPNLSNTNFINLSEGMLLAWEQGRLQDLIEMVSSTEDLAEDELLKILVEANVLTALHTAESVKAKLLVLAGLYERIKNRELENAVRDYIAEEPWLISPQWELFRKEKSVSNIVREAAEEAKLNTDEAWDRRIDLVLGSGDTLLIVEFMRPGLNLDADHISRFEQYVQALRVRVEANTALQYRKVTGYVIADKLANNPTFGRILARLKNDDMYAMDWEALLLKSAAQWREFLEVLVERAPEDERLKNLLKGLESGLFPVEESVTI